MIKIGLSDFLGYKDSPFDWFEIYDFAYCTGFYP